MSINFNWITIAIYEYYIYTVLMYIFTLCIYIYILIGLWVLILSGRLQLYVPS